MSNLKLRLTAAAVAIAGAGAMGVAMAAPAGAAVTGVSITTPSGYGSVEGRYGTSCQYNVEAKVSGEESVDFYAVQKEGEPKPFKAKVSVDDGKASATWVPSSTGAVQLHVVPTGDPEPKWDDKAENIYEATVGTGLALPGVCVVVLP